MELDKVILHILWRETANRIAVLQGRVNEGVDVDGASEFARWLRFSGLLKILESAPDDPRLPCKGSLLTAQVETLVYDCGQWYANHERANRKPPAQVPRSELESINAQLASLRETLAKLSPSTIEAANVGSPALLVIEGGVKSQ